MSSASSIAGVLLLLAISGPAGAETLTEKFESPDELPPILQSTLLLGQKGTWEGSLRDGSYVVTNSSDPAAVQFFHFGTASEEVPEIGVDVSGNLRGPGSGLGILYRFNPETRTYLALTITSQGYAIWKRDLDGFHRLMAGRKEAVRRPGPKRLVARSSPEGTEFLINGEPLATLSSPDITGSQAGLIAMSTGEFRFDNLFISSGN